MAYALTSAFTRARLAFNDLPLASTTLGLQLANELLEELLADFKLVTATKYIVLDGIARDFTLDPNYKAVWNADYIMSANAAPIALYETSVDQLDASYPGWRMPMKSMPTQYYVENTSAPMIGFDFIPSQATSPATVNGYPIVRIVVSEYTPMTDASNLPTSLKSPNVFIKGLIAKWADAKEKPDVMKRIQDFETAKLELSTYINTKQKANPPRLVPFFSGGRAAV